MCLPSVFSLVESNRSQLFNKKSLNFYLSHKQTIFSQIDYNIIICVCAWDANKNNGNESRRKKSICNSFSDCKESNEKSTAKKKIREKKSYGKSDEVTELHPPQAKTKYEIIAGF